MRIIAGRFRRRRLATAPGHTTRPLTDRVKVKLFQRLEPFDGERILDVFAGTGTIGLEALSRGAAHAVFVERDHKAFELLCENVRSLGLTDDTFCWRADVLRCSFRPKGREELVPYDRIFFDPPYAIAGQIRPGTALFKAVERLGRPGLLSPNGELVLRVPLQQQTELPDIWHCHERLEAGGMAITRLRLTPPVEDSGDTEQVLVEGDAWEEE
jgi:16S rRNA (guanine966-N2)-methyltransferase